MDMTQRKHHSMRLALADDGTWSGNGALCRLEAKRERSSRPHIAPVPPIPDYLRDVYTWAYLSSLGRRLLDRQVVVNTILWGNAARLTRSLLQELEPGQTVLQVANVYGSFSRLLAERIGAEGMLDVIDIAPIQVATCQEKVKPYPNTVVRLADAVNPGGGPYDVVCCYFLLHEVPEDYKSRIVEALLSVTAPGGKVVFVDYHRPRSWHPLKGLMSLVFRRLEPFARTLWDHEIASYAPQGAGRFGWSKETFFGGLYQKVVARRAD